METVKTVLSAVLSYAVLIATTKLVGRRQIAQLDFMDYITGITIGSIAAELATNLENLWEPLVALVVYALITWGISLAGLHWPGGRKYISGTPAIVMENGRLYRDVMRKAKLDLSEFMVMCRQQGYFDLKDIHTAVLENNGKLTILPVSARRPATPEDLKLHPPQETIAAEVIMDGRILGENLHRMGLDEKWLQDQLRLQGVSNAGEVYLGLCSPHRQLTLYHMKDTKQ